MPHTFVYTFLTTFMHYLRKLSTNNKKIFILWPFTQSFLIHAFHFRFWGQTKVFELGTQVPCPSPPHHFLPPSPSFLPSCFLPSPPPLFTSISFPLPPSPSPSALTLTSLFSSFPFWRQGHMWPRLSSHWLCSQKNVELSILLLLPPAC